MKQLWSPWRMSFIEKGMKLSECIFCDLPKKGENAKTFVIHKGKKSFIILNRYPYTNGHLMVIPRRHKSQFEKLTSLEHEEINQFISLSIEVLKKVVKAQGFNVGLNLGKVAGAGIENHLHYHIVPRWTGDHNFMPVLSEVRMIPDHIESTYQKLKTEFDKRLKK